MRLWLKRPQKQVKKSKNTTEKRNNLPFHSSCYNMSMRKPTGAFYLIAFILLSTIFGFGAGIRQAKAEFDCLQLNSSSNISEKQYCQAQLDDLNRQLANLNAQLDSQKKQSGTLKSDVTKLTTEINALKTKIKSRALTIAQLKVSITEKTSTIKSLSAKIEREHESLAQLLRNTNEFDNENFVHLVLSDLDVSSFYSDMESYVSIQESIKASVDQINGVKVQTEVEKTSLEKKQDAETDAKAQLESAQKKVAKSEANKKQLLAVSKQKEGDYAKLVAEKKARADRIRSALFSLAGISQKIEFGTALNYANEAERRFGIDPAFLLAVLTQESNLGSNVGQCYLSDLSTGYGTNKATGKVYSNLMKPTRDIPPFIDITRKLGLDPLSTTVSCPVAGVAGYGGAMGPAQFIPSTWVIFENRLKSTLGYEPNPWSPRDAFMASSLYLTDLGAIGDSQSAQNRAACRYYGSGGSSCTYSRSVQKLKSGIQDNIDLLSA